MLFVVEVDEPLSRCRKWSFPANVTFDAKRISGSRRIPLSQRVAVQCSYRSKVCNNTRTCVRIVYIVGRAFLFFTITCLSWNDIRHLYLTRNTSLVMLLFQSNLLVNPMPFLQDLTGKSIQVKLKWGQVYQGQLASSDSYMNLQLTNTEEFINGEFAGKLGEVLIRCNNVLYVKAAPVAKGEDDNMQEG